MSRNGAGFVGTLALKTASGMAAGSAVLVVPLVLTGMLLTGCGSVRQSALYPETLTLVSAVGYDNQSRNWDRETVGVNLTWRLKQQTVVAVAVQPIAGAAALPVTTPLPK